jgi:hypothetical protein
LVKDSTVADTQGMGTSAEAEKYTPASTDNAGASPSSAAVGRLEG